MKTAKQYKNNEGQYDFPVGIKLKIQGIKVKVTRKEYQTCSHCILGDHHFSYCEKFACLSPERSDKKPVIFEEIK